MAADLAVVAASLAVLALAADRFVASASKLATLLGASPLFVGVVLVGVGTSLPDWLASAFAAAAGNDGLAVGNVVGSNTVNIGLALAAASVITPIVVSNRVLRREAALSIAAVGVFSLTLIGGIGMVEAILLLVALPIAFWVLRPEEAPSPSGDETGPVPLEMLIALLTLAATVGASKLLVNSAADIAGELGVSDAFIGLSLVAIGTSLPEIVVGIQAARQRATELVVGNVLGSNLVNSLGVAGTAGLLAPDSRLDPGSLTGPVMLMVGFALIGGLLLATGRRLERWEGVVLLIVYCTTLPLFA